MISSHSDMRVAEVRKFCKLDGAGENLVRDTLPMNAEQALDATEPHSFFWLVE